MKARKSEKHLPLERSKKKERGGKSKKNPVRKFVGSKLIKEKHIAKSTQLICISIHIRS